MVSILYPDNLLDTANATPIGVFPAYDKQPEPSADDYIMVQDYPAVAYF